MALDNVLALFLLPLFGHISDKCTSRHGRRTPFIVIGTLIAAVALVCLSFVDNAQLKNLQDVSAIDDPAALSVIYEEEKAATLLTPSGEKFILGQKFTEEEFTGHPQPDHRRGQRGHQPRLHQLRGARPAGLRLADDGGAPRHPDLLRGAAAHYSGGHGHVPLPRRGPDARRNAEAPALQGQCHHQPHGSAGGILVLALGMVFATSAVRNSLMSYIGYFGVIAALMLAALVIFLLTVREQEWSAEMQQQAVAAGLEEQSEADDPTASRKLSADEVKSLIFILLSIVLWFFGYNAVTSKYSVYASNILHKDYNLTLIIAQAAAIVAYLPVGFIASKVGRKKTILAGVVMLTAPSPWPPS